jgi:transcriptional regulator with XRE-family HTH domain
VREARPAPRPLTPRQQLESHPADNCGINARSLGAHESGGRVGGRLRTARRSAGLTQKELGEALGVEAITVSRWERGVTTPSLPRLRRIAEITETTVSDLVRAPDAASAHAVELAALREELAETRAVVDRVARTLDQLARPRSAPGSASASRDS